MIIDIIILTIVVLAGVFGIRKGFMFTFIRTAQLIMSLVLAFIATPFVKTFIQDKTTFYDSLIPAKPVPEGVPKIINDVTYEVTSNLVFTVTVYLALLIVIRLLIMLLLMFITKDYKQGVTGFIDGFFGLIFGLVKGLLLVFVLLAVMIPLANVFMPDIIPQIMDNLDTSYGAKSLYDNNYLMVVLQNFFIDTV